MIFNRYEHLEKCDYKVCGYWDEHDEYYEEIILPRNLDAELISSSIGMRQKERFLQLKFILKVIVIGDTSKNALIIGELLLIYDENLGFIDENWILDVASPILKVRRE